MLFLQRPKYVNSGVRRKMHHKYIFMEQSYFSCKMLMSIKH